MKHKPIHARGDVWGPFLPQQNVTAAELLSACSAPGLRQAGFLLVPLPDSVVLSTLSLFCQNLLPLPSSAEI